MADPVREETSTVLARVEHLESENDALAREAATLRAASGEDHEVSVKRLESELEGLRLENAQLSKSLADHRIQTRSSQATNVFQGARVALVVVPLAIAAVRFLWKLFGH